MALERRQEANFEDDENKSSIARSNGWKTPGEVVHGGGVWTHLAPGITQEIHNSGGKTEQPNFHLKLIRIKVQKSRKLILMLAWWREEGRGAADKKRGGGEGREEGGGGGRGRVAENHIFHFPVRHMNADRSLERQDSRGGGGKTASKRGGKRKQTCTHTPKKKLTRRHTHTCSQGATHRHKDALFVCSRLKAAAARMDPACVCRSVCVCALAGRLARPLGRNQEVGGGTNHKRSGRFKFGGLVVGDSSCSSSTHVCHC